MLKRRIKLLITIIIIIFSSSILLFSIYLRNNYGEEAIYQIVYYLNNSFEKGSMSLIYIGVKDNALFLITISIVLFLPVILKSDYKSFLYLKIFRTEKTFQVFPNRAISNSPIIYSLVIMMIFILFGSFYSGLINYVSNSLKETKIYENAYVDPSKANITFPSGKNNLILIFLESMETSYLSIDNGGIFEKSIVPELEKIALNNINFTHNNKIGGPQQTIGSSWTAAAMVAHTAGIPLLTFGLGGNNLDQKAYFLPGAYSMGEILAKEGYNQQLMVGSDANFGGRKKYFEQHGNYAVYDLGTAQDNGNIPSDYLEFWGFEDAKLFQFAKNEITKLANDTKPFNFTMLTVDSHNPGYDDPGCKIEAEDIILKTMSCTSLYVNDFINWLSKQPYYNSTTIVIVGDHLGMNIEILDNMQDTYNDYTRTTYNAFINSKVVPINKTNRIFTAYDFYPSILAAMGAKIEGEQLGLGVNLFSDKATLAELMGFEEFNKNTVMQSHYYYQKIFLKENIDK